VTESLSVTDTQNASLAVDAVTIEAVNALDSSDAEIISISSGFGRIPVYIPPRKQEERITDDIEIILLWYAMEEN